MCREGLWIFHPRETFISGLVLGCFVKILFKGATLVTDRQTAAGVVSTPVRMEREMRGEMLFSDCFTAVMF